MLHGHQAIMSSFECSICNKSFSNKGNHKAHIKRKYPESAFEIKKIYTCFICIEVYEYEFNLHNHIKEKHTCILNSFTCPICQKTFTRKGKLKHHMRIIHYKLVNGKKKIQSNIVNQV